MTEGQVMDDETRKYQEAIRATIPSQNNVFNESDKYAEEVLEDLFRKADEYDKVNSPDHYTQGNVECIDAIEAATVDKFGLEAVCVANVIKYLWRYEVKNGLEDVKKAQWYLNKLVERLENNDS